MKAAVLAACLAWCCASVLAQTPATSPQASQPPSYANFSIMLVNPAGGAVVLMHNPKNGLEFVDVSNTKQALSAGYVPVRAAELAELIAALKEENARLAEENGRLRDLQAKQDSVLVSPAPAPADVEAQRRAQIEAEREARRERMIQGLLVLQAIRPQTAPYQLPTPVNPSANRVQTDCTTQTYGNTAYTNCH